MNKPKAERQYRFFEIASNNNYTFSEISKKEYKECLFPDKPQTHKLIVEVEIIPTDHPDFPQGMNLKITNLFSIAPYRGVSAIIQTLPLVDKKIFQFKSTIGMPGSLGKETWRGFCLKVALYPMIKALAAIEEKVAKEHGKETVLSITKNTDELYWIFRVLMKL